MFAVIEKDGRTPSNNPKFDAYKYMAWLAAHGRGYNLCVKNDEYAVAGDGLMVLIFVKT